MLKKQGFTLIELLIVVAIIAILAGVVLVSTNSSRNRANGAATKTTLLTLKSALAQCCSNVNNSINSVAAGSGGGAVCSASSTPATYPTSNDLKLNAGGTVQYVGALCSASYPTVSVTLTGHPNVSCNATWSMDLFGNITVPPGC